MQLEQKMRDELARYRIRESIINRLPVDFTVTKIHPFDMAEKLNGLKPSECIEIFSFDMQVVVLNGKVYLQNLNVPVQSGTVV